MTLDLALDVEKSKPASQRLTPRGREATMRITDLTTRLPRHATKRYRRRRLDRIDRVVVHHSGTPSGSAAAFAMYHVRTKGWPGIAYHYVITKTGQVQKTNPISLTTYHAPGANLRGIGICLVGNYNVQDLPGRQYAALIGLINELLQWRPTLTILGHREVRKRHTACPGSKFDLDKLREALR